MWASKTRLWVGVLAAILLCGLSGCAAAGVSLPDFEVGQEDSAQIIGAAGVDQTVGQTFSARRPGLNGITLWLKALDSDSPTAGEGVLVLELYHSPEEATPLAVQSLRFAEIEKSFTVDISLPAQPDSAGQSYYVRLRAEGGYVQVYGSSEDRYPQGQAYFESEALNADLAFRLTYEYGAAAIGEDLGTALSQSWLLLPLAMTLLVPGWLLLDLTGIRRRFDFGSQIGLSAGLSLAVIPLVFLWTTTINLRLNRTSIIFAAGFLAALLVWRLIAARRRWAATRLRPSPVSLLLLAVFALALGVRLAMVRDLSAPAWVDSPHHAAITRLIVEQGRIPDTYAPLIDIESERYHPGFHSALAVFHWLSGMEISAALLLFGQVANALAVFGVYLLARTLTRSAPAALVAAMIAGLLTPMPAYYATWGRYTQLDGLLILPVLAALAVAWRQGANRWVGALLGGIAGGGLLLVHYRVAAFAALLLLACFASELPLRREAAAWWAWLKGMFTFGLGIVLAGVAFSLPWFGRVVQAIILPTLQRGNVGGTAFADFSWQHLTSALGLVALVLAGLGLPWAVFRGKRFWLAMLLWVVLLLALANPSALGLPGGAAMNTLSVEIMFFMPIAVLGGYLVAQWYVLGRWILPRSGRLLFHWGLSLGLAALALAGARTLLPMMNVVTILFRSADRPALAWIEQNIPANETILINPFEWGYGLYAGADGGIWIPALASHPTLPPPVLYGMGSRAERQRINALCQAIISGDVGRDPQKLAEALREQGIHYVYLGARGGELSPALLRASPAFEVLYAREGTWVFAVRAP